MASRLAERGRGAGLVAALVAALLALLLGGCEGDPGPPQARPPTAVGQGEEGVLRLVGTGAMTPLARRLAAAWAGSGGLRVVVEPSVGSGGGVRAAYDGAVDLGMISRPLKGREPELGLVVVPVARGAVVLGAHRELPRDGLSGYEVERLYAGEAVASGGEAPLTLLLRDREESANGALERLLPALGPLRERAYALRRFRVIYHDEAMREALAATPGAVGVLDLDAVVDDRGLLKGLAIDGVRPGLDTLSDGRWRATRELAFVYRPERAARVEAFVRFARSPAASAAYAASGCVALGGWGP